MNFILFLWLVVGIVLLVMKIFQNSKKLDNLTRRIDRLEKQVHKSNHTQGKRRTGEVSGGDGMVTYKTETYDLSPKPQPEKKAAVPKTAAKS